MTGLEKFRDRLSTLHIRLRKLPKNPRTEKSVKRKIYMQKVAEYFGITPNNPFNKVFYFETLISNKNQTKNDGNYT